MIRNRYLTTLLTFLMCFGIVFSANAASDITAKQMIIKQLSNLSEYYPPGDINKSESGTTEIKIKTFKGLAAYFAGFAQPLNNLAGSDLKINYKTDFGENKIQGNYVLNLNNSKHSGELFLDKDQLIVSNDIISLIREFEPNLFKGKYIPHYLYLKDEGLSSLVFNGDTSAYLTPEYRELCVFFLEAIPDKYFSVSLSDQKIIFEMDRDGFEDVALSVLLKIKNEKDRFDKLLSDYLKVAAGTGQDINNVKNGILFEIESSINNGTYPDTKEELKELLGNFKLKEFKSETSIIPGGENKITARAYFGNVPEEAKEPVNVKFVDIGNEPFIKGQIDFISISTNRKDKLQGSRSINVTAKEFESRIKADLLVAGEYNQTAADKNSNITFSIDANDFDNNVEFIDLVIEGKSRAVNDQDVQVNIPVLTGANSKDLKKIFNNTPDIFINGVPVACDVDPYVIKYSDNDYRIMVPLRNIAEALGCRVTWVEPGQINIVRKDTDITIFINNRTYTVNGVEKPLNEAVFIVGKRVMVPLTIITSELGCTFDYDFETNTVNIYSE